MRIEQVAWYFIVGLGVFLVPGWNFTEHTLSGVGNASDGINVGCPGCNVILVSVDTLRADHLGTFGYNRDTTPRIDAAFARGSAFDHAVTPAPCTFPAVHQFLTSRLSVAAQEPHIAELLHGQGYETGAVVSQQLFRVNSGPRLSYLRGFDSFDVQDAKAIDAEGMSARTADEVTRGALKFVDGRAGNKPFFLWAHYYDPHDPYDAPEEWQHFDDSGQIDGGHVRTMLSTRRKDPSIPWEDATNNLSAAEAEQLRNRYDDEIRWTDQNVGALLDGLATRGLLQHSVVVFTADHGESLGEHHAWTHCQNLWREEVHVPLLWLVRGGPLLHPGHESEVVSTLDIVPTLLGLLGQHGAPQRFDGVDLLQPHADRQIVVRWGDTQAALFAQGWKLYRNDQQVHLYSAPGDWREQTDIAAAQPELVHSLQDQLDGAMRKNPAMGSEMHALLEQLHSIGYIQ